MTSQLACMVGTSKWITTQIITCKHGICATYSVSLSMQSNAISLYLYLTWYAINHIIHRHFARGSMFLLQLAALLGLVEQSVAKHGGIKEKSVVAIMAGLQAWMRASGSRLETHFGTMGFAWTIVAIVLGIMMTSDKTTQLPALWWLYCVFTATLDLDFSLATTTRHSDSPLTHWTRTLVTQGRTLVIGTRKLFTAQLGTRQTISCTASLCALVDTARQDTTTLFPTQCLITTRTLD